LFALPESILGNYFNQLMTKTISQQFNKAHNAIKQNFKLFTPEKSVCPMEFDKLGEQYCKIEAHVTQHELGDNLPKKENMEMIKEMGLSEIYQVLCGPETVIVKIPKINNLTSGGRSAFSHAGHSLHSSFKRNCFYRRSPVLDPPHHHHRDTGPYLFIYSSQTQALFFKTFKLSQ
jgi:hypothetical protein